MAHRALLLGVDKCFVEWSSVRAPRSFTAEGQDSPVRADAPFRDGIAFGSFEGPLDAVVADPLCFCCNARPVREDLLVLFPIEVPDVDFSLGPLTGVVTGPVLVLAGRFDRDRFF